MTTVHLLLALAALAVLFGIDLSAALRLLTARELLPDQREVAGLKWAAVPAGLQAVLLAAMRVGGLGLLVLGLSQLVAAVALLALGPTLVTWLALAANGVHWVGMALIAFGLRRRTGAATPWKPSLVAVAVTAAAMGVMAAG